MAEQSSSPPQSTELGTCLWEPTKEAIEQTQLQEFGRFITAKHGFDWGGDFKSCGNGQSIQCLISGKACGNGMA